MTVAEAAKEMQYILEEYGNDTPQRDTAIATLTHKLMDTEPSEMYWQK